MHSSTMLSRNEAQWYAIYCGPLKEKHVAAALAARPEVEVYLPGLPQRERGQASFKPLFPRYLFVLANLSEAMNAISTTPGVLYLVTLGGVPQSVPASMIAAIRQQVDELRMQRGDAARSLDELLQRLRVVFLRSQSPAERVCMVLEFLLNLRESEGSGGVLEGTDGRVAPKRQRGTRGRGRVIRRDQA